MKIKTSKIFRLTQTGPKYFHESFFFRKRDAKKRVNLLARAITPKAPDRVWNKPSKEFPQEEFTNYAEYTFTIKNERIYGRVKSK